MKRFKSLHTDKIMADMSLKQQQNIAIWDHKQSQ